MGWRGGLGPAPRLKVRKEYGQALRGEFERRLGETLPRFTPVKIRSDYVWPGERVFRWEASARVHVWIVLVPNRTGHESFAVEIGWSALGRFPELPGRPSVMVASDLDPADPPAEATLRLGTERGQPERWFDLPNPAVEHPGSAAALAASLKPIPPARARAAVTPHVEAAVAELSDHAVPYLEAVARHLSR